jgi:hypothetical protein
VTTPTAAEPFRPVCWGWSDVSEEDAREKGRQRVRVIAEKLREGASPEAYVYADRPLREKILDEWKNSDGVSYALVTLNAYGCQVLNTTAAIFVDVDLNVPEAPPIEGLKRAWRRLLGKEEPPSRREQQENQAVASLKAMFRMDAEFGARIYRTCAGLRYLFTHSRGNPASPETLGMMSALGADPLYVKLCRIQECYRARLTPKPWRCGMSALSPRYPWADEMSERTARSWLDQYAREIELFATCRLLQRLGRSDLSPEVSRIVEFHDKMTKAASGLELA